MVGGWYYQSDNGIFVQEFFDDTNICVYNNFEGDIYRTTGGSADFPITFDNHDFKVQQLSRVFWGYDFENDEFKTNGKISPNGRQKFIYEWITSDYQYLKIRTLDNSQPDKIMHGRFVYDGRWVNENYLLFLEFFSHEPILINVNSDKPEYINILEALGISKQQSMKENEWRYSVQSITKDQMVFIKKYDHSQKSDELLRVKFSFDVKGSIILSKI